MEERIEQLALGLAALLVLGMVRTLARGVSVGWTEASTTSANGQDGHLCDSPLLMAEDSLEWSFYFSTLVVTKEG